MTGQKSVCAVDLGASGGKVFVSRFSDESLSMHEVYRFPNHPVYQNERLCWDLQYLLDQTCLGIAAAFESEGNLDSISVDTWGFDYVSCDAQGHMEMYPRCYRDSSALAESSDLPPDRLYRETGIPPSRYTTLSQLYGCAQTASSPASRILWMPNALLHWLGGSESTEKTIASTSQLLDIGGEEWSETVLRAFHLRQDILPALVPPSTITGRLRKDLQRGERPTHIVVSAGHDTAAAVAALPAEEPEFLYLISGTWSLLGATLKRRYTNKMCMDYGLHNQQAADGKNRLQKGITGLWICQQLRNAWSGENTQADYTQQDVLAAQAEALRSFIDTEWLPFTQPENMREKIISFCQATQQPIPDTFGRQLRCVYDSMAMQIRIGVRQLEEVSGLRFDSLFVAGGGTKSTLFMQQLANATGKYVRTGFADASALGNALLQLIALGAVADLSNARRIARKYFAMRTAHPTASERWNEAEIRFQHVIHSAANS